ncbi:Ger(x)C family spore germination protein [Paenibacillus sp. JX-17]|uniref:Ger(X)C family spore germination protein n=1 Tax=Paenibacillus lacisoli TaxID=3064525 RepID=A0ABT9CCQ8_9BACL|nr:Ger(x)C family spore germination protein [Paenibacillus sp. JX-17]MDO7906444.1 Ger(x)C family spore germination protein [Paenibacillus sp. JX-17]
MRRVSVAAGLLLLPLVLGGCWDRREVNDVAFVMGSAVDKEANGYRTTLQIAMPSQLGGAGSEGGGGGTSGDKSWYLESRYGETIRASQISEQRSLSRMLHYSHRRMLLIGEDLARSGVSQMMDVLVRMPQNRLSSLLVVTSGPAYKVIQADAPIEKFPSEMVRELSHEYMKKPRSVKSMIHTLIEEGVDSAVPLVGLTSNVPQGWSNTQSTIAIEGLAVFHGDRMTGAVRGNQAKALVMAMNQSRNQEILVTPPDGSGKISVMLYDNHAKLIPHIQGDRIRMTIRIDCRGSVVENESAMSLTRDKSMSWLEQQTAAQLKEDVEKSVRLIQKTYKSDVLGMGNMIYTKHPEAWQKFRSKWDQMYPEVDVDVKTLIHIENLGTVSKPLGKREDQIRYDEP